MPNRLGIDARAKGYQALQQAAIGGSLPTSEQEKRRRKGFLFFQYSTGGEFDPKLETCVEKRAMARDDNSTQVGYIGVGISKVCVSGAPAELETYEGKRVRNEW